MMKIHVNLNNSHVFKLNHQKEYEFYLNYLPCQRETVQLLLGVLDVQWFVLTKSYLKKVNQETSDSVMRVKVC